VTDAEKPLGCRVLGDVVIGVPPDAARPQTEDELVILMRNKVGDGGGDHLVVDMTEQRNASGTRPYWIGRGRSYSCPDEETPSAPPEESMGGEEEGGDEEGDEAEGGEAEGDTLDSEI